MRIWIFNLALLFISGLSPSPNALAWLQPPDNHLSTADAREGDDYLPKDRFAQDESSEEDDSQKDSQENSEENPCAREDDKTWKTDLVFPTLDPTLDAPGTISPFRFGPLKSRTEVRISSSNDLTLFDVFYVNGKAHHCSLPRKVTEEEALRLLQEKSLRDPKLTLSQAQALRDVAKKLKENTKDDQIKSSATEILPKFESLVASKEKFNLSKPQAEAEPSRYKPSGKIKLSPLDNGYSLKTPSAVSIINGVHSDLPPGVRSDTLVPGGHIPSTTKPAVTPKLHTDAVHLTFDSFGIDLSDNSSVIPKTPPTPADVTSDKAPKDPTHKETKPSPAPEAKPIAKETKPPAQTPEPSSPPVKTPSAPPTSQSPLARESKDAHPPSTTSPRTPNIARPLSGAQGETQEVVFEKKKTHSDLAGISSQESTKQNILANSALKSDQEVPFGLKGPGFISNNGFEDFKLSKNGASRELATAAEKTSTVFPSNESKKISPIKDADSTSTNTYSYRKEKSDLQQGGTGTNPTPEKLNGNGIAYSARNPEAGSGSSKVMTTATNTLNSTPTNFSDSSESKLATSKVNSEKQRQGVKTATFWSPYSSESELPDGTGNLGEVDSVLTDLAKNQEVNIPSEGSGNPDPSTIASSIQKIFESTDSTPNVPKTALELEATKSSNDIADFSDAVLGEKERAPASSNLKTETSQASLSGKRPTLWQRFLSFFRR